MPPKAEVQESELGERVFYVGDDEEIGRGSSGKVRELRAGGVYVDWGGDVEGWLDEAEVVGWERFVELGKPGWA